MNRHTESQIAAPPGRPRPEEIRQRYAAIGLLKRRKHNWNTYRQPLTAAEREEIKRLRPTHTLKEIGEIFGGRHASTIAAAIGGEVQVDFRGKRRGQGRRMLKPQEAAA